MIVLLISANFIAFAKRSLEGNREAGVCNFS